MLVLEGVDNHFRNWDFQWSARPFLSTMKAPIDCEFVSGFEPREGNISMNGSLIVKNGQRDQKGL